MKTNLRAGVIGTGFIGPVHLEALSRIGVSVAALCDLPDRVKAAAETWGIPEAFGDYRDLVRSANVDVVPITSPNRFHCEMALAALRAGKHVVCEKPLAMNTRQAGSMVREARSSGFENGRSGGQAPPRALTFPFSPGYLGARERSPSLADARVRTESQTRHCRR